MRPSIAVCVASALLVSGCGRGPVNRVIWAVGSKPGPAVPQEEIVQESALLQYRLKHVGMSHARVATNGDTILADIPIRDSVDPETLLAYLERRGELDFYAVVEDQSAILDAFRGRPGIAVDRFATAATPDALAPPSDLVLPPGQVLSYGFEDTKWRTWLLDGDVSLRSPGMLSAVASPQPHRDGWEVILKMNPAAARAFEDLTAREIDDRIAVVVDGEVIMTPVVQEKITGGNLVITMAPGAGDSETRAKALVATLQSGVLPAPLRRLSLQRVEHP